MPAGRTAKNAGNHDTSPETGPAQGWLSGSAAVSSGGAAFSLGRGGFAEAGEGIAGSADAGVGAAGEGVGEPVTDGTPTRRPLSTMRSNSSSSAPSAGGAALSP